jgi:hypothetical protein
VVRFYTVTGGRTRPSATGFDLVAFVVTVQTATPVSDARLHPEHLTVLDFCRRPVPVAELAARLDLPVGVVRVLLGDLLDRRLITVQEPKGSRAGLPDRRLLEKLVTGLREL